MGADETRAAIDAANRACPPGVRSPPKNAPTFCATGSFVDGASGRFSAPDDPRTGQTLAEAKGEISYAASFIEWFAKKANAFMATPFLVIRPISACCYQAADWRHRSYHAVELPGAMITRKAGPALAAGCTMVLKLPVRRRSLRWRWRSWRFARASGWGI